MRVFSYFTVSALLLAVASASTVSRCLGCPMVIDPQSNEVHEAVAFAVQELNLSPDNTRKFAAAVQVVNGLNYHITFEVQQGNKLDVFKALVYRNATDLNAAGFSLTSVDALLSRQSGGCPGCVRDIDVADPHVVKAADFAWTELAKLDEVVDTEIGQNFKVHVAGVQVVSGLNYFLLLEAEFDNIRVMHTATVYKDLQDQYYLTRTSFDKHLIPAREFKY